MEMSYHFLACCLLYEETAAWEYRVRTKLASVDSKSLTVENGAKCIDQDRGSISRKGDATYVK